EPDRAIVQERPVLAVTTAPSALEGEGFPVRRAFAGVDMRALDPFIHMDQMGEVHYAPGEPRGTAWHPHRGFETVTYMIDGTFRHQDSNGGGGLITNGDTQWMTAGGGILHIEEPPEELVMSGGLFHGFQLWVNLPAAMKMTAPRYQDIRAGQVALLTSADGGTLVRVIAGDVAGHSGPDYLAACDAAAGGPVAAAVASRLQRARLRDGGLGQGGRRAAPGADRPVGRVRPWRRAYLRREQARRRPQRGNGSAGARRPADQGAGRRLWPVRHEHQGRACAGFRGLPGRPARLDP